MLKSKILRYTLVALISTQIASPMIGGINAWAAIVGNDLSTDGELNTDPEFKKSEYLKESRPNLDSNLTIYSDNQNKTSMPPTGLETNPFLALGLVLVAGSSILIKSKST